MYDALTINKQQQHLSSFLLLLLFYFNIIIHIVVASNYTTLLHAANSLVDYGLSTPGTGPALFHLREDPLQVRLPL